MPGPKTYLDDYIEVKDRVAAFYDKYPEGSIQTEIAELQEGLVIMKAYAYRNPEDSRPATGHSQMPIPGRTSFTRDSEIENAETSAIGRAIAALGFEVKRSFASRDEIKMKSSDEPEDAVEDAYSGSEGSDRRLTPGEKRKIMSMVSPLFSSKEEAVIWVEKTTGKKGSGNLTARDMKTIIDGIEHITSVDEAIKA